MDADKWAQTKAHDQQQIEEVATLPLDDDGVVLTEVKRIEEASDRFNPFGVLLAENEE